MSTKELDTRLRERGNQAWKDRVKREVDALQKAFPENTIDGHKLADITGQFHGFKAEYLPGNVKQRVQISVNTAFRLLRETLEQAGADLAGQREVDTFLAKVDRLADEVTTLRLESENLRHD